MARKIRTEEENLYDEIPDGDSFCGGDSDHDLDEMEDPSEMPFLDDELSSDDEKENVPLICVC